MNERDEFDAVSAAEKLFKKDIDIDRDYLVEVPIGIVVQMGLRLTLAHGWAGEAIAGPDDDSILRDLIDRFDEARKIVYTGMMPQNLDVNQPATSRLSYRSVDFLRKVYLHSKFPFHELAGERSDKIRNLNMILDIHEAFVEAGGAQNIQLEEEINEKLSNLD